MSRSGVGGRIFVIDREVHVSERYPNSLTTPAHVHDLDSQLERLTGHPQPKRKCPRCRRRIVPVRAPSREGELILDECPHGHGLWFDQGELGALIQGLIGDDSESLEQIGLYLGQFAIVDKSQEDGQESASETEGGNVP